MKKCLLYAPYLSRASTLKPDGTPYKEGDIIKRPKLTLKVIAADPMSFYNGLLADDVVADIQETGTYIAFHSSLCVRHRQQFGREMGGKLTDGKERHTSGFLIMNTSAFGT